MELNEIVKQYGEKDGNIYRIWLDGLNGVCNLDGHTDIMCAHLGEDGILTFQVNTPDDQSTIFVHPEELPDEARATAVDQILEIAFPEPEVDAEVFCPWEYTDINGRRIGIGDKVFWHDEAGRDEEGYMIIFTIVDGDGDGYFNLANEGEEFPERWAYNTEIEIV